MSIGDLAFDFPPTLNLTWSVPDFLRLATVSEWSFQSPEFPFANGRYGLRLFQTRDIYLIDCIYIELVSLTDPDPGRALLYQVQVKSGTGEEDMWRDMRGNRVEFRFSRTELERERDRYVPDGILTLLCSVRPREQSVGGTPNSGGDQTRVIPPHTMTIGELSSETTPSLYVTWTIPRFFRLARGSTRTLESPEFPFSGRRHRLRLIPSRFGVKIFLVNLSDSDPGRYASYELGLKSTTGEEIHIHRDDFPTPLYFYILRSALDPKESQCFPDGHLTVFCCVGSSEPSSEGRTEEGALPETTNSVSCAIQTEVPESVSCANQTEVPESVSCANQTEVPESVSCGIQTEVLDDQKHSQDEEVSSLDTKGNGIAHKTTVPDSASNITDKENPTDENVSSIDTKGVSKLVSDLRQLLQKVPDSDACLVVRGKEFRAHRNILRARSTVFDAMFGHETAERESGRVTVDNLDPDCFRHFMEYLYTGGVGVGLSDDNAFGLYKAADKYDVPTLKVECVEHMRRNLSVDSFCDVLAVALRHSEDELLSRVILFFRENMPRIIVTPKWKQFAMGDGASANEVFIRAFASPGE